MARHPRAPKTDAPYPPGWELFLAGIRAHLDEDTPRLVFADWLQENGDEARAEFIRLQCELYRVNPRYRGSAYGRKDFTPGQEAAYEREQELFTANHVRWKSGFPSWMSSSVHWVFRRGFIGRLRATPNQFFSNGERVLSLCAVDELWLEKMAGADPTLYRSGLLTGFRSLHVPEIDSAGIRSLADSPALDMLSELGFGKRQSPTITPGTLQRLLHSPRLKNLTRLILSNSRIGDEGLRQLVKAPLSRLETLNLRDTGLTAKGAHLLANWPGLESVRSLVVAQNRLDTATIRTLVESPYAANLSELWLPSKGPWDRQAAMLWAIPAIQRIPNVVLNHIQLSAKTAR